MNTPNPDLQYCSEELLIDLISPPDDYDRDLVKELRKLTRDQLLTLAQQKVAARIALANQPEVLSERMTIQLMQVATRFSTDVASFKANYEDLRDYMEYPNRRLASAPGPTHTHESRGEPVEYAVRGD